MSSKKGERVAKKASCQGVGPLIKARPSNGRVAQR